MFAKIFAQIFDSSLAEDWQTRHVFEDLLKLCDQNGVVDMTHEAIARRTNVPLEIIKHGITELEKPDTRSRNPANEGRRLVRLDEHRDWGWYVTNYAHYRQIASEDQRREKTLARVQRHREKLKIEAVTHCNAVVTPVTDINAGNAMQKQMQKQMQKTCSTKGPKKGRTLADGQKCLADMVQSALGDEWENDAGKWLNRITGGRSEDRTPIDANPAKVRRVFAEVVDAIKHERITGTPAAYAEFLWKEYK